MSFNLTSICSFIYLPLTLVVLVGFNAPSYTVDEGANQVQVCVRLAGTAELARPIQMRVSSSKDGTATGNYVAMNVLIYSMFINTSIPFTQISLSCCS